MDTLTRQRYSKPGFWISAAAKTFFVGEDELLSTFRGKDIQEYRMATMWVAHKMTRLSYPQLARAFNRKDHTSIMDAVRRVEGNEKIGALADEILEYVEAGMPE